MREGPYASSLTAPAEHPQRPSSPNPSPTSPDILNERGALHHTTHIATAKRDRSIAESHLGHLRTAIDDRARDIDDAVRHAREIEHEGRRRPQWQSEIDAARTAIRVDLEAREQKAVHMPSLHALAELEPRPRDPHRAKLWNQIAARIDQHHTAYPHYRPDRENREPSAYKRSHDNTQAWTAILDKALHPEHEIEHQHQHAQQRQQERTHDHGIEI